MTAAATSAFGEKLNMTICEAWKKSFPERKRETTESATDGRATFDIGNERLGCNNVLLVRFMVLRVEEIMHSSILLIMRDTKSHRQS